MKEKNHLHSLSTVASLGLLAVFALLILSVLLGGAGAYRRLTQKGQQQFDSRTCAQYIATKVRQAPEGVQTDTFGMSDALVIPQTYGDTQYVTRVYCYHGWLMELFTAVSGEFSPEDGERLMPAEGLSLSLEDGLLTVLITDETGKERPLLLDLSSQEVQR